jgi:hypothetical protein
MRGGLIVLLIFINIHILNIHIAEVTGTEARVYGTLQDFAIELPQIQLHFVENCTELPCTRKSCLKRCLCYGKSADFSRQRNDTSIVSPVY